MKKRFLPVSVGLTNHLKIKTIEEEHGSKVRAFFIAALVELWTNCHFDYQDGTIYKAGKAIETMARWQGEKGKFIEIATNEDTCFIDKISSKEYRVHNYYKHNPLFRPGIKGEVSVQKSKAGHTNWAKITAENLLKKGIKIDGCPWLSYVEDGAFHYIKVEYKNLPDYIELEGEIFHQLSHFEEINKNSAEKTQADRRRLIRKYTKKCKKCGALFISSLSDKFADCR